MILNSIDIIGPSKSVFNKILRLSITQAVFREVSNHKRQVNRFNQTVQTKLPHIMFSPHRMDLNHKVFLWSVKKLVSKLDYSAYMISDF